MEQSGPISADLILISLSISLSRPSEIGAGAAVWEGGEEMDFITNKRSGVQNQKETKILQQWAGDVFSW